MNKRKIYADYAATAPIKPEVLEAMMPYLTGEYGNPSSLYSLGQSAAKAIERARKQVADAIGALPQEIYFTSGGSESDNWAIAPVCRMALKQGKNQIITTSVEHHAVLNTVKSLEKEGFEIIILPVNENGLLNASDVERAITGKTALVTVMLANNEIGTVLPVGEIGDICRRKGVLFHTDAVQAIGNVTVDVAKQNIDLLSLSGHKIGAQKGIGALYVRKGVSISPLIYGGSQERNRRAGTENVPAIVGLGVAIEKAACGIEQKVKTVAPVRDYLIGKILTLPMTRLNGDKECRLCGNINVSVLGVEGEALLLMLDLNGISASSGSACTSGSLDPSHVLLSLGLSHEWAHGSLRLSFDESFTMDDADYVFEKLTEVVEKLRAMSPLWERINKS